MWYIVHLDISTTACTEEQHLTNLSEVWKQLQRAGLWLKKKKCELLATSVVYLHHKIDAKGFHPTNDKLAKCQLKKTTELIAYLGLLNY